MDSEQPKPAPGADKKRVWERVRARFRKNSELKNRSENSPGPNSQQPTPMERQRVQEIREVLAQETPVHPEWVEKEVSLDSINIRTLPIGWNSLSNLGRAINQMKDDPFDGEDMADVKPPHSAYSALPMVASVVANRRNPEIPVVLPTQDEVKAMKPWLATVEKFIGRFSQNWARKFGGYIEKRGQRVVVDFGNRIADSADLFGGIQNPRGEFVIELSKLYNQLARPEYQEVNGVFSDWKEQVRIEDKVQDALDGFQLVRDGKDHDLFSKQEYPMLTNLLPIIKFPPDSRDDGAMVIAASELMEGVHVFLRNQGVRQLEHIPQAKEFNLFDLDSWGRGIAETFFSDKLERVKQQLPNVLSLAHQVLPESGTELSEKMYSIAENICVLKAQGHQPEELSRHVFVK